MLRETLWPVVTTSLVIATLLFWYSRKSRLPPGPRGLPWLGNALQIPPKLLFLKLDGWHRQYGDIFTFTVAGQRFVSLGTARAASEVLDRNSLHTSGRPYYYLPIDIMTKDRFPALMQYGDRWRRARRVTHETFSARASVAFHAMQESESLHLLRRIAKSPSDLHRHFLSFTAATTWRALYGGPELSADDEAKIEQTNGLVSRLLRAMSPVAYFVNMFPLLRYVPAWAAGWKRAGEEYYRELDAYILERFEEGCKHEGSVGFVAKSAKAREQLGATDQDIAWTATGLFGAGLETTAFSLEHFVLAMVLNPEVARKGQEQIDAVVGDRPPSFEDRAALPYVEALVKETLRWRAVIPLGLPHVATADVSYGDVVIPNGTFIFANIWSMCRDPGMFPDYDAFRPERYLDSTTRKLQAVQGPGDDHHDDSVSFGFGRRSCPGREFARKSMFIAIAHLLWAFEFCEAPGETAPSDMEFVDESTFMYPAPFKYVLKQRRGDFTQ